MEIFPVPNLVGAHAERDRSPGPLLWGPMLSQLRPAELLQMRLKEPLLMFPIYKPRKLFSTAKLNLTNENSTRVSM